MRRVVVTYRPDLVSRVDEVIEGAVSVDAEWSWVKFYSPVTGLVAVISANIILKVAVTEVPDADTNKGDGD